MAANFGMMSDAYFVGKNELLRWLNDFLSLSLQRIEECANGAIYCQLLDALYPGKVPMKRVDFTVKSDFEFIKNWKIVQDIFRKMDIQKLIPVDRIIRARYQDNLEFLQWFYQYFNNVYVDRGYDPVKRRRMAKGGSTFISASKVGNHLQRKGLATGNIRGHARHGASEVGGNENRGNRRKRNPAGQTRRQPQRAGPQAKKRRTEGIAGAKTSVALEDTQQKLAQVERDHSELVTVARDIEKERDFYFKKVVTVEQICKAHPEQGMPLLQKIFGVLYQTDDGTGENAPTDPPVDSASPISRELFPDGGDEARASMDQTM